MADWKRLKKASTASTSREAYAPMTELATALASPYPGVSVTLRNDRSIRYPRYRK